MSRRKDWRVQRGKGRTGPHAGPAPRLFGRLFQGTPLSSPPPDCGLGPLALPARWAGCLSTLGPGQEGPGRAQPPGLCCWPQPTPSWAPLGDFECMSGFRSSLESSLTCGFSKSGS